MRGTGRTREGERERTIERQREERFIGGGQERNMIEEKKKNHVSRYNGLPWKGT